MSPIATRAGGARLGPRRSLGATLALGGIAGLAGSGVVALAFWNLVAGVVVGAVLLASIRVLRLWRG